MGLYRRAAQSLKDGTITNLVDRIRGAGSCSKARTLPICKLRSTDLASNQHVLRNHHQPVLF